MRRRDRHVARIAGVNERLRRPARVHTGHTVVTEHLSIHDAPVTRVPRHPHIGPGGLEQPQRIAISPGEQEAWGLR